MQATWSEDIWIGWVFRVQRGISVCSHQQMPKVINKCFHFQRVTRKIVVQIWRKDFCRFTEEKDAWARLSRGSTKSIQVLEILLKSTLLGISRHWRAWRRGFAAEFHKKCVAVFRQGRSRFGSRLFSAVFHPRLLSRALSLRGANLPTIPILRSRQRHSHRANAGRVTQNHDPRLCWCAIQKKQQKNQTIHAGQEWSASRWRAAPASRSSAAIGSSWLEDRRSTRLLWRTWRPRSATKNLRWSAALGNRLS